MSTGIRGLTVETAAKTDGPTDLRTGTVAAVSARGIDVDSAGGTILDASHLGSYNPAVGDPVAMLRFQDSWVVLGRPVGPGTTLDTGTPGPSVGMNILDGMVLSGTNASGIASSTGALVNIPRYSLSFFHPPGHWVALEFGATYYSTVANDWMTIQVVNVESGFACGAVQVPQVPNNSFSNYLSVRFMVPPTFSGARTYIAQIQRIAGTGTCRIDDSVNRRGHLIAVDMGPTAVLRTT